MKSRPSLHYESNLPVNRLDYSFLPTVCFLDPNVDYSGNDINIAPASSMEVCRDRCANWPGCPFFTYDPYNDSCMLKASNAVRSVRNGWTSGKPCYTP